jgi:hypothetical protein
MVHVHNILAAASPHNLFSKNKTYLVNREQYSGTGIVEGQGQVGMIGIM